MKNYTINESTTTFIIHCLGLIVGEKYFNDTLTIQRIRNKRPNRSC